MQALLNHIRAGDLLVQLSLVPESRRRYDFPFIKSFPAFLLTPDNGYLKSPMYQVPYGQSSSQNDNLDGYQPQYLKPYHGAQLLEPLLEEVTPSGWTTVISNKALFRRLLTAYILFQYPSCPAFKKELFLQDLALGETRFCSPLLVNAVLACASVCSVPSLLISTDKFLSKRVVASQIKLDFGYLKVFSINFLLRQKDFGI